MTKKKKLILIFSIIGAVIVAATATVLIIVLSKKKPEESGPNKPVCVAPEITVADEGIYWASVANAESYYYNYNAGEWTQTKEMIAFPTEAGEYTLQLKAVDSDGKDGKITTFAFNVAKMTVECERVDNTLHFNGERIYFSVNGMEEGALGENNILDFSNDTTGAKYTVQYYAKGGYFSKETNTFYLDSAKQTRELTTTQMLTMPTLQVNEAGTHLVWTASDNAQSYAVSVDGEQTTVSTQNATVAFPMTEGTHTITVQAVGDGETWYSSLVAEYKMTTKRESVPTITFDSRTDSVYWEEAYAGKMQISTDGNTYTPLNTTTVAAQTSMALKVGAYYAEAEKTYYLESKPVSFEKREVSLPSFSIDGYVNWNQDDESLARKYYVSVVEQTETAEYTRLNENVKNISFLSAGAYTLSVYAADYVEEQTDKVMFYLPSEAKEIDFSVLANPTLSYEKGKLLWKVDPLATSYEYRVDGTGDWETATESGVLRTRDMATYEVRAIGSGEAGRYALTSSASTLFFDPELEVVWDYGKTDLALFNNARYAQITASANVSNATKTGTVEVVTSANASSAAEQAILAGANDGSALKVTAGNASPFRKAYWGNSDGASIELFQPLPVVQDARIIFRVCTICRARMKKENLANERELFYYGVKRLNGIVKKAGRKTIVWNDELDVSKPVDIPKDVTVQFWRVANEHRGPRKNCSYQKLLEQGFEVVCSPFEYCYIDLEEYANPEKTASFDYKAYGDSESYANNVVGCEVCAWEYGNPEYSHYVYSFTPSAVLLLAKLWDRKDTAFNKAYRKALSKLILGGQVPTEYDLFELFGSIMPPRINGQTAYATIENELMDRETLEKHQRILSRISYTYSPFYLQALQNLSVEVKK